jgi:hypothetical protein
MSEETNAPELDPTEIKESEEAYNTFLSEAKELDASTIIPFRADEMLALHNVKAAQKNVLARKAELEAKKISADEIAKMAQSRAIALAVIFAVDQAERIGARSPKSSRQKRARAGLLRRAHLLIAEGCALLGLVPLDEVETIKAGNGPTDSARDCIELTAFYRRHQKALDSKTPSNPELQKEMAELGTEQLNTIVPTGAKADTTPSEELRQAQDTRDRIWTLLQGRYDLLVSAATKLVGRNKVRSLVPPLQSRIVEPKKADATTK